MPPKPLSAPQQKALALVPQIVAALGDVAHITPAARTKAQKLVEAALGSRDNTPAEQLQCGLLKTFLSLHFLETMPLERTPAHINDPLSGQTLTQALERFIHGDYRIEFNTHPPAYYPHDVFLAGDLRFGNKLDGWTLSHIAADAIVKNPAYSEMAEAVGGQLALLLQCYSKDTVVTGGKDVLDVLNREWGRMDIIPFQKLDMFEFAGPGPNDTDVLSPSFHALFPKYKSLPSDETRGKRFSLEVPHNLAERPAYITTLDVMAHRGHTKEGAYTRQANLLCMLANQLPDGGKLYVTNSCDPIDYTRDTKLLQLAGLRCSVPPVRNGMFSHMYVLERDFALRPDKSVMPPEFTKWEIGHQREVAAGIG